MTLGKLLQTIWFKTINAIVLRKNHVEHKKSYIFGRIKIYREHSTAGKHHETTIYIGDKFVCNSGLKYNPIGGDTSTILRTIDSGIIIIGENVGISNASIVARDRIEIEDDVIIGGGVKIYDNDFHSLNYDTRMEDPYANIVAKPVRICKGAFIGAGSYILKGVTIGKHSVVGAGAVVTNNIPDNEIWAGNPARFVKSIG